MTRIANDAIYANARLQQFAPGPGRSPGPSSTRATKVAWLEFGLGEGREIFCDSNLSECLRRPGSRWKRPDGYEFSNRERCSESRRGVPEGSVECLRARCGPNSDESGCGKSKTFVCRKSDPDRGVRSGSRESHSGVECTHSLSESTRFKYPLMMRRGSKLQIHNAARD